MVQVPICDNCGSVDSGTIDYLCPKCREAREAIIPIGSPATYYIGSDSYAEQVVEVQSFKTGKRAGLPKVVITRRVKVDWAYGEDYGVYDQEAFTPNPDGRLTRFTARANGRLRPEGSDYGTLTIGKYREYRDPSF